MPDRGEVEPTERQVGVSWEALREAAERVADSVESDLLRDMPEREE